jgi:hypothetical protein
MLQRLEKNISFLEFGENPPCNDLKNAFYVFHMWNVEIGDNGGDVLLSLLLLGLQLVCRNSKRPN